MITGAYSGEPPFKKQCIEISPYLENPEKIGIEHLNAVAREILHKIEGLSPFSAGENFRSKVLNAVHHWWRKADLIPNMTTVQIVGWMNMGILPNGFNPLRAALKVRHCCMGILTHAEKFRKGEDSPQDIQVLLDDEVINWSPLEVEIWKMASPVMNSMLGPSFQEFADKKIRLPEINGGVLKQISRNATLSRHWDGRAHI